MKKMKNICFVLIRRCRCFHLYQSGLHYNSLWCNVSFVIIGLIIFPLFSSAQAQSSEATKYVNPFIGTGAVNGSSLSGNNFPGVTMPFGMVQLSPDTREAPSWDVASGYNHNDNKIYGFSHTHLSGTGVGELFDILLLPITGNPFEGGKLKPSNQYFSDFSHKTEKAKPGFYQVDLSDYNVNVQLTATEHAGFHSYLFSKDSVEHVLVDLNHSMDKGSWSSKIIAAQMRVIDDHTIEGFRIITGWAKMRKVYFYAQFSRPIISNVMADGGSNYSNQSIVNGTDVRAIFNFQKSDVALLIKVGISPVSMSNAKLNLTQEIPDWDFNKTVENANTAWEKELSKIQIEGTSKQKEIFYTALYHTFIQPNKMADVNGDYMAADYTTQNVKDGDFYSTFSLWDTYRAANPLYTLVQPKKDAAFIRSMLLHFKTFGYLPIWSLWGQENYCMIGNHAIPVIVDAVLKGIKGFDIKEAYKAVVASSEINHPNSPLDIWEKYHYMPEDLQSQSVSITLEMCYDDWCVAQFAKKMGKINDYNKFIKRSNFYKNLFDSSTGFFRAKNHDGKWLEPFNPLQYGANGGNPFTEGNAWQYLWYVPQNIKELIVLLGGEKSFVNKLDRFFTLKDSSVKLNDNASGLIGQYAHGNEPSHHVAYLYDYAGAPWKTQFYVSKIMKEMYNNTFSGYAGNEDCGQMSAWYIFSAIGFYPVNPASGIYAIGSPLLSKATIHLSNGNSFTVIAKDVSEVNKYIQSATLNGKIFTHTFLTQKDIEKGGRLDFIMGAKPNKNWGVKSGDAPLNIGVTN